MWAAVSAANVFGITRSSAPPRPGPVGGPCLEKDPHIFAEGLRELGMDPALTMAARALGVRAVLADGGVSVVPRLLAQGLIDQGLQFRA